MERLSQLINMAVDQKIWKHIQLSRGDPLLSNLAFADDLISFVEADMSQVEVIHTCLGLFCNSSSQKINNDKTRIYFSRNVNWNVRQHISDSFGFQRMDGLGKYLGVPLHDKSVKRQSCHYILERAMQRLSQWKQKHLFFAGRITLTKFVLTALPNYVM